MRDDSMKTYRVKGHALMPVEVVISVKAQTSRAAMKAAEEFLNNAAVSKALRNCIVDNSGDPAAVLDFEACDANEVSQDGTT